MLIVIDLFGDDEERTIDAEKAEKDVEHGKIPIMPEPQLIEIDVHQ